jgi:hypothetical protein
MTASSGIPGPVDRRFKISCLGDRPLPVAFPSAEVSGHCHVFRRLRLLRNPHRHGRKTEPNERPNITSINWESLEKDRSANGRPHPYAGILA